MAYLGTEIHDGALYCDVTPESLGLPVYSASGFRINWPSAIWDNFGSTFQDIAKSTCPVDTGNLRANIGYSADGGGVECWSDAEYSAYQEYGTYKMHAQPYFEAALQSAQQAVQSAIDANLNFYREMDADWMVLMGGVNPISPEQCLYYIERITHLISIVEADGRFDPSPLYDAYYELMERYEELMEQERLQQAEGLGGFLAQLAGMLLGALIVELITAPIEIMFDANDTDGHSPSHG